MIDPFGPADGISAEGYGNLIDAIGKGHAKQLQWLDLSGDPFSNKMGALEDSLLERLANAVRNSKTFSQLTRLDIAANKLHDVGISALAEELLDHAPQAEK